MKAVWAIKQPFRIIFNFSHIIGGGGFVFLDPWYEGQKFSLKKFGKKNLKKIIYRSIPNIKKNGGIGLTSGQMLKKENVPKTDMS